MHNEPLRLDVHLGEVGQDRAEDPRIAAKFRDKSPEPGPIKKAVRAGLLKTAATPFGQADSEMELFPSTTSLTANAVRTEAAAIAKGNNRVATRSTF